MMISLSLLRPHSQSSTIGLLIVNDYQSKLGQIVPASLPLFLCMYSPFYLFVEIHAVSGLTYNSMPVIL